MVASAPTISLKLPPVFKYQERALFSEIRYAVVEGSTKVGKTFPCIIWLLSMMGRLPGPDHNFWWVAPTVGQALIAYTRTKRMLLQADPEKLIWSSHDTDRKITIHGCGHLWFKTGEVPDNLYGEDVYAAVMDEFTRQREEAWFALRSTLTATQGRCRFIGNVNGKKNWGWFWARKAQAGAPGMAYSKLTCDDAIEAGIMDQAERDQAEQDLPHRVFRELYYAEASDDGSNPFGITAIAAAIESMHQDCEPLAWGWDLARAQDWTVGVGICQHGCVCRLERWNQSDLPQTKIENPKPGESHQAYWAITLDRVRKTTASVPALVDSTGPGGPIDNALAAGGMANFEGYVFSNRSKQMLMEGLALAIQQRQVRFPDGVLRQELESFEYQYTAQGRTVTYAAPEGMHDDCVCAFALAVRRWLQVTLGGASRVPVFDAKLLGLLSKQCRKPILCGDICSDVGWESTLDAKIRAHDASVVTFSEQAGPWRFWTPIDEDTDRPREAPYLVAVSVGTGLAGCPTVVKVGHSDSRIVVAEAVLEGIDPERAARAACLAGMFFAGAKGRARLIWQRGPVGPSVAFGEAVRRLGYGRVYRTREEGQFKADAPWGGWQWTREGLVALVSEFKTAVKIGNYVERSGDTAADARGWVQTQGGEIRPAAMRSSEDAAGGFSDRTMAAMLLSHAMSWQGLSEPSGPRAEYGSVAWEEAKEKEAKDKKRWYLSRERAKKREQL